MIDWLTKLPDGALALLLAGSVWFGFNYAVLAERAMERELRVPETRICAEGLGELQASLAPRPSGVGSLLGMPALDALEARIIERAVPPLLSAGERMARCACAVAEGTASQRLDYAIHTATFRLWPAADIAAARGDFVDLATHSRCAGASS